jgi:hypothetical protein
VNQVVVWGNAGESLTVAGRPLESQSGTIETIDIVDPWYYSGSTAETQTTVLNIPAPGCWELTGRDENRELTIVIDVQPFDERPDVVRVREWIAIVENRFPVPASCSVNNWDGPSDRVLPDVFIGSAYWLEGDGLGLFSPVGFLAAGENISLGWWSETGGPATLDLRLLDSGATSETLSNELTQPGYLDPTFNFPVEGCWELQITGGDHSERFVVYVRPAEALDLLEGA